MQLSQSIKELYQRLVAIQRVEQIPEGAETIGVDDVVSKLSVFYEKLRNTVDYQEDHLLRRYAIERDLRRRVVLETLQPKIARQLIENLIRSGYLPNQHVQESSIQVVQEIIAKYVILIDNVEEELKDDPNRRRITLWLASIMACEIDLELVSEARVDALVETLFRIVKDRIKFKGDSLPERERNIQVYITLHRELVKSDDPIIAFHLFNLYFPDWERADRHLIEFIASKITSVYHGTEHHLHNSIRPKIAKSLKPQIVAFKILRELITIHEANLSELFGNPEFFESEARKVIERFYRATRKKLRVSSIRAIVYIFITKVAIAFALEYPYDVYIAGHVNYIALAINILFPPTLMFAVTLTARLPGPKNTKVVIDELMNIVYGEPEDDILCELRVSRFQGPIYFFFEYLFYILLYGIIFGFIVFVLQKLHFNVLSGAIFIFFVTAVTFFATRIRQMTKEYQVEQKREGFRNLIIIFLTLPIIRAGHWLSFNLSRINLFVFILDFIIEAPFKLLVELMESWFTFLKEKREDTYKNT